MRTKKKQHITENSRGDLRRRGKPDQKLRMKTTSEELQIQCNTHSHTRAHSHTCAHSHTLTLTHIPDKRRIPADESKERMALLKAELEHQMEK